MRLLIFGFAAVAGILRMIGIPGTLLTSMAVLKTRLLRMLKRLDDATRCHIRFEGMVIDRFFYLFLEVRRFPSFPMCVGYLFAVMWKSSPQQKPLGPGFLLALFSGFVGGASSLASNVLGRCT
mmetsp:Transcript_9532/g.13901  ORF Transcript_9532/g.13901 Transcript_9532/m.13901 type:complete len:123 (+) Transcript_9532:128-496(+)